MHPQTCRFATLCGLIIKGPAVARKAQQKLTKNINEFCLCNGGFEKERRCLSNEPLALTPRCFHTTVGISGEEFYWFQWHGLSVGLGILHFTGWGDERRITILHFKHALITLSGFYSVLQQLLITALKGEGEQFLPSTLWHSNCWSYTHIPRADAIFSWGSSSSPNTVWCFASHTHAKRFLLCFSQTKATQTWCRKFK